MPAALPAPPPPLAATARGSSIITPTHTGPWQSHLPSITAGGACEGCGGREAQWWTGEPHWRRGRTRGPPAILPTAVPVPRVRARTSTQPCCLCPTLPTPKHAHTHRQPSQQQRRAHRAPPDDRRPARPHSVPARGAGGKKRVVEGRAPEGAFRDAWSSRGGAWEKCVLCEASFQSCGALLRSLLRPLKHQFRHHFPQRALPGASCPCSGARADATAAVRPGENRGEGDGRGKHTRIGRKGHPF